MMYLLVSDHCEQEMNQRNQGTEWLELKRDITQTFLKEIITDLQANQIHSISCRCHVPSVDPSDIYINLSDTYIRNLQ